LQPRSKRELSWVKVPTVPLIYRLYELVRVYGTTIRSLIHGEFCDGLMSAIDFSMGMIREPDPKGDQFTWS